MKKLSLCLIVIASFFTSSCKNYFTYEKKDWKLITQTQAPDYKAVYVDLNRINCNSETCKAWIKMIFGHEEEVGFSGNKQGEVSGYMKVKRMDASVSYDCNRKLATIISYQLYDKSDTMMDAKWINFEPEYATPGTIHGDILKYLCK
jgi:hypothetical protein